MSRTVFAQALGQCAKQPEQKDDWDRETDKPKKATAEHVVFLSKEMSVEGRPW